MPEWGGVFGVFVEFGTREGTLAPNDTGDLGRKLSGVRMGDHSSNVVSDDMDRLFDAQMLRHQFV